MQLTLGLYITTYTGIHYAYYYIIHTQMFQVGGILREHYQHPYRALCSHTVVISMPIRAFPQ